MKKEIKQEAIEYVKANWSDYSTADGGWDTSEGVDSFIAGYKLAMEQNKKAIDMHERLVDALKTIQEYNGHLLLPVIKISLEHILKELE